MWTNVWRRLRFAGLCQKHPEVAASKMTLWEPMHGHWSRRRPKVSVVEALKEDTGINGMSELAGCMGRLG